MGAREGSFALGEDPALRKKTLRRTVRSEAKIDSLLRGR